MSTRTLTFLIAILGTLATGAAALTSPESTFHLSPAAAMIVSSIGAGLYACARAMQKVKAGASWKSLLSTTEAKGALIVYLASLTTALYQVVPPAYAGGAAFIVTVLVALARQYTARGGGFGVGPGPLAVLLFVGTVAFATPAPASSPDQQITQGNWSYGPALAFAVAAVNLRDGNYSVGLSAQPSIGGCFGATYNPLQLGGDLCGNLQLNKSEPNRYFPSLMLHWRNWIDVGFGALFTQGEQWAPLLLIGPRMGIWQGGAPAK